MGYTIAQKIIKNHLVCGEMTVGSDIGLKIDQTLTQDATGTMAYIEYEAMGIPRVKTEKSVAYIDHNTLQTGFENADDHRFIQSVCKKHGIYFSRPGNGICHQVHLERFGKPGKTLIGSDSHTPTGGGIGMLAIGAGGLDVAVAMGGGAYYITMPKMVRVNLTGKLSPWVSAKDIILAVLRVMSVKGGVGKIVEYGGEGTQKCERRGFSRVRRKIRIGRSRRSREFFAAALGESRGGKSARRRNLCHGEDKRQGVVHGVFKLRLLESALPRRRRLGKAARKIRP